MAARAILFDLDGTIWDSVPWYAAVLARGEPKRRTAFEERLRSGESVINLGRGTGFSRTALLRACIGQINELQLFPGVRETLEALGARKVPMGVVTSLAGDLAIAMMAETSLETYFQTVVHAGNCRARKSSGKPLRLALIQMGIVASSDVFYVGDRLDDAKGARASSISFAWASYGYGTQPPGDGAALAQFSEVLGL